MKFLIVILLFSIVAAQNKYIANDPFEMLKSDFIKVYHRIQADLSRGFIHVSSDDGNVQSENFDPFAGQDEDSEEN